VPLSLGDGLRPFRLMRSSPESMGRGRGRVLRTRLGWSDCVGSGAITLHASPDSREGTAHGRRLHAAWHRADRPTSRG
jgi:hypothetical protein